jgi:TonB family protein
MSASATDVIVARARQVDDDLRGMLWWSVGGHVVLLVLVVLWASSVRTEAPQQFMTISLGGVTGPDSGGQTQIGARAVQEVAPPEAPAPPVAPPAPTPPPVTLPTEAARPAPPRPRPARAPDEAPARRPNAGREVVEGNARAETTVDRGVGFGLSSGGGGDGATTTDVANFCCPEYLALLQTVIKRGWDQNAGASGSTTIRFTISRDGSIRAPEVEVSSGLYALDNNARRAVQTAQLPPLPNEFTNPTLTIHLRFEY